MAEQAAMPRIVWAPANDEWMTEQGFMEWQCAFCKSPLTVAWRVNCDLYDTDEPIKSDDGVTNWWQVGCHGGHVLLLCHEVEESSGDTFEPPTTKEIALWLASEADVIEWEDYEPPKPPWKKKTDG